MKDFGTFDTTNTLYGSFYSRQQDPITNIPKYSKPNMEEEYYNQTVEMRKGYFNRYAHLYPDPTGKPIYNPIDSKLSKKKMLLFLKDNMKICHQCNNKKKMPLFKDHMYLLMKCQKKKVLKNL